MYSLFMSLSLKYQLFFAFFAGKVFTTIIMFLMIYSKNQKISAYKRQVEKESVLSDESSARVRVLEQKIEVLEKALDNALNGK